MCSVGVCLHEGVVAGGEEGGSGFIIRDVGICYCYMGRCFVRNAGLEKRAMRWRRFRGIFFAFPLNGR